MPCIYAAVLIKAVTVPCTFQSFSVKKPITFKGPARHTVYDSTNTMLLSTRTCRKLPALSKISTIIFFKNEKNVTN